MIIGIGSLEYAHARIHARWGGRADEALWHRLEGTRELATLLELARGSALAHWVEGVAPGLGLHEVERTLRGRWRRGVAEVAAWMPADWQVGVAWCAPLVDLPLVQALARGQPPPAWAREDEALGPLLDDRATTPEGEALRGLLADTRNAREGSLQAWRERWLQQLPPGRRGQGVADTLVPLLQGHAMALGRPGLVDAWAPRRALHAALARLLRRHGSEPLTAFVYLALRAIELERLRGEIVRRVAFPRRWMVA